MSCEHRTCAGLPRLSAQENSVRDLDNILYGNDSVLSIVAYKALKLALPFPFPFLMWLIENVKLYVWLALHFCGAVPF